MREQNLASDSPRLPGIIDTLTAALAVLGRAPWLLLPPLLLNLLLWVIPPLRLGEALVGRVLAPFSPDSMGAAQLPAELGAELATYYDLMSQQLLSLDVWSALTWPIFFWPPLILGDRGGDALLIENGGQLFGMGLALAFVGLLLNMLWLAWLARVVGERPITIAGIMTDGVRTLLRIVGLGILLAIVFVMVISPLVIGVALVSAFLPGLAGILNGTFAILILWGGIWLGLHLYFVLGAMLLDNASIMEGTRRSILLVRRNFWSALGLMGLSWVLSNGFFLIWIRLGESALGKIAAMTGSAALGTVLAAAMMIYYQLRVSQPVSPLKQSGVPA